MARVTKPMCGFAVAAFASVASAQTLEQVEQNLVARFEAIHSYKANVIMTQDMDMGDGHFIRSTAQGTIEWQRSGSVEQHRAEMTSTTTQALGAGQSTLETRTLAINDGQAYYTLSQQEGESTAVKMPVNGLPRADAKAQFDVLRKDHSLKLLPDEKVDGQDCRVIEATPRDAEGTRQVLHYRKDCGVQVRMVAYDAAGKPSFSSAIREVRLNVPLGPQRFQFQPPPGVEVTDLTRRSG